jgi:benzaldehyde dehydrogenase (NAD)
MSLLEADTWSESLFTGEWRRGSGEIAPVVEPATGEELGRYAIATAEDVDAAVARAKQAQRDWGRTPFHERAAVLRRAGEIIAEQAEEIERWIIRESGGIPPKAQLETEIAQSECFEAAALPSHPSGEILPTDKPYLSLARRLPVGVVGVIAPFNFPLILSIRSVAPALALGNSVVLKPDPRTAVCGGFSLARVFEEAGLPEGVFHVLPGRADAGVALVEHPDVPVISFTGSTPVGRKIGEACGRNLKRCHLELGGNNALIVLDDVDIDRAVGAAAFGSFIHQGQVCMTTGRHIVHERIFDEYAQRLADKAEHLPVGDPNTEQVALGPIIDEGQRDHVHELVTASREAGANVAAGGTYEGLFYRPTVLTDVRPEHRAWAEEVFGPVAPVARFSSIDELITLANDNEYGLSLGILTRDVMKGLALADEIPSGIVHVNDQTVADEAVAPFGGVKASGNGTRFGGAQANIEAFTEAQWVTLAGEIPPYPF